MKFYLDPYEYVFLPPVQVTSSEQFVPLYLAYLSTQTLPFNFQQYSLPIHRGLFYSTDVITEGQVSGFYAIEELVHFAVGGTTGLNCEEVFKVAKHGLVYRYALPGCLVNFRRKLSFLGNSHYPLNKLDNYFQIDEQAMRVSACVVIKYKYIDYLRKSKFEPSGGIRIPYSDVKVLQTENAFINWSWHRQLNDDIEIKLIDDKIKQYLVGEALPAADLNSIKSFLDQGYSY